MHPQTRLNGGQWLTRSSWVALGGFLMPMPKAVGVSQVDLLMYKVRSGLWVSDSLLHAQGEGRCTICSQMERKWLKNTMRSQANYLVSDGAPSGPLGTLGVI